MKTSDCLIQVTALDIEIYAFLKNFAIMVKWHFQ